MIAIEYTHTHTYFLCPGSADQFAVWCLDGHYDHTSSSYFLMKYTYKVVVVSLYLNDTPRGQFDIVECKGVYNCACLTLPLIVTLCVSGSLD